MGCFGSFFQLCWVAIQGLQEPGPTLYQRSLGQEGGLGFPARPTKDLRLRTQSLHDDIHQNPENTGTIIHMGSCNFYHQQYEGLSGLLGEGLRWPDCQGAAQRPPRTRSAKGGSCTARSCRPKGQDTFDSEPREVGGSRDCAWALLANPTLLGGSLDFVRI